MSDLIKEQDMPTKNNLPAMWDLVMDDMRDLRMAGDPLVQKILVDMQERDQEGVKRYNTRLQPFNSRDALVDAYQEKLDTLVYMRQSIYEAQSLGASYVDELKHQYQQELWLALRLRSLIVTVRGK